MQFKKLVAAGTLAAIMVGSSVGFAALNTFPAPFVTSSGVQSFVVVGQAAMPDDVVGAVDLAARLGGSVTTDVAVPGASAGFSISGEGKVLDTTTTHVFLQDNLGKSGLRTTLTKDDMPVLLARGSFADSDGTHKFDQFIDVTPGSTNAANVRLDFDKPGSSSSADPTYNFGRFATSPSVTEYMYKVRVVFDVAVNGTNARSKSLRIFGNDYTVSADTTAQFTGTGSEKLVLFGGANIQVLKGGETVTTTVGGSTYTVTLLGVESDGDAVVQVGSTTETIAKSATSSNFGDLKIYIKDSASLSTTDQSQNVATLLIGADKITLQNGAKVKKGNNDDTVDGTLVNLTGSSGKLSQVTIYFAGTSSTNDFISEGSSTYLNPVFKTLGLNFASMTPTVKGASDDYMKFVNSGDNDLQATMTDFNGNTATINYGHKATSAEATVLSQDSSGNVIHLSENETVARDEYIILDAGGYTHMFKVSSVNLDGSSSASIDLLDVFTSTTTKVTTGTDNQEAAVIDGQTYYFNNVSSSSFNVNWGAGSSFGVPGTYWTIYPTLKSKQGALVAFANGTAVPVLPNATTVQLPSGAVTISHGAETLANWTLTAANREDGVSSVRTANTDTNQSNTVTFTLGRTATGGLRYQVTKSGTGFTLTFVGASGTTAVTNQTAMLVEEKDDAGNQAAVVLPGQTAANTAGNNLAGIGSIGMTGATTSTSNTWGSNSNKASSVDLWGLLAVRDTSSSSQPTVELWYPDIQRMANVFVLASDATVTQTSGGGSSTVKSAVPVKTALGKLDTEITSADRSTKNLILVGGPAVNTLVAELAAAGKTQDVAWYRSQGSGTALIDLVSDAFASGKSALVVAGWGAADTRAATSRLQNYDAYTWTGDRVVLKNGVVSTTTA